MPNLLGFFSNCIRSKPSSDVHHNSQVTNSIVQLITSTVDSSLPSIVVPGTLAQILASTYTIFHSDSNAYEKALHVVQALTASARCAISITLLYGKDQCDVSTQTTLCLTSSLLDWVYSATVSSGLAASTYSKSGTRNPTQEHEQDHLLNSSV